MVKHSHYQLFTFLICWLLSASLWASEETVSVTFSETPTVNHQNQWLLLDLHRDVWVESSQPDIQAHFQLASPQSLPVNRVVFVEDYALGSDDFGEIRKRAIFRTVPWEIVETRPKGDSGYLHHVRVYPFVVDSAAGFCQWTSCVHLTFRGENIHLAQTRPAPQPELNQRLLKTVRFTESHRFQEYPRLKIEVSHAGLIRLTRRDIRQAGWNVSQVDPRQLKVLHRGVEIPIRVLGEEDGIFDDDDSIIFWVDELWNRERAGEIRKHLYGLRNVYWLKAGHGNGLRLSQEQPMEPGTHHQKVYAFSYPQTQHIEKDLYFSRLPYSTDVDDADHWLTTPMVNGGEKYSLAFELTSPYQYATQAVAFRGRFQSLCKNNHQHPFEIFINDVQVYTGEFVGNQTLLLDNEGFSAHFLKEKNEITIVNRSADGPIARLAMDWFELIYPAVYETRTDSILFKAPYYAQGKLASFEVKGFTSPNVLLFKPRFSHFIMPNISEQVDTSGTVTYRLRFEDLISDPEIEYFALTPDHFNRPDTLIFQEETEFPVVQGADYIAVFPSDTLGDEILDPLFQIRRDQGLTPVKISLQSIYDEFHDGIPHPEALKNLLRYGMNHWNPKPRFLLLVGDGHYRNLLALEKTHLIPAPYYQTTKYGAAATDFEYTLLDDDLSPDLAVGRLPVSSRTDLENVINKIVAYEVSTGEWHNNYLMIGAAGHDNVFETQSETLIKQVVPNSRHPERLYLFGDFTNPFVGGTEDLLRHMRRGLSWINFRGHGGGAIWSDGGLLDLDDVPLIENRNRLPIITSMTCFTSDFSSTRRCLGEALVCQRNVGAVAFMGSTGLGWVWNDYYLLNQFIEAFKNNPGLTLGEILDEAKDSYLRENNSDLPKSVAHQFVLLGDPATRWKLTREEMSLNLSSRSIKPNASFEVHGNAGFIPSELKLEFVDDQKMEIFSESAYPSESDWNRTLTSPPGFPSSQGGIRAFAWNSSGEMASGFAPFAFDTLFVDSLALLPSNPTRHDSIGFQLLADHPDGIQSIQCLILSPAPDSLSMISSDSSKYISLRKIGPFAAGTRIQYTHKITTKTNRIIFTDTLSQTIASLPDLMAQSLFLTGRNHVQLGVRMSNYGGEPVSQVPVRIKRADDSWATDTVCSLEGYASDTLYVPVSFPPGTVSFQVFIDPDSSILEANRSNNQKTQNLEINRFQVSPEWGTSFTATQNDTIHYSHHFSMTIPPGAVSLPAVLTIDTEATGPGWDLEPDMVQPVHFDLSTRETLTTPAAISMSRPADDTLQTLQVYSHGYHEPWTRLTSQKIESRLVFSTNTLGYFALMHSDDFKSPTVELQVNNQPFVSGSYVSQHALFTIILQDESGLDLSHGRFQLYLDQQLVDANAVQIPDSSASTKVVSVSYRREFEPGTHELSLRVQDIHGNRFELAPVEFFVEDHMDIQFLGNHPNPFSVKTVFAYVLTNAAENLKLKIYTVSGRLIRTFDDVILAAPDYHEITWDGRDEWGERVANGVYFFSLNASSGGKNQTIKGKIALIR